MRSVMILGHGDLRLHLGTPALLANEAVRRRSPRSVACADAGDFLRRYGQFIRNCANALKSGGKLAILMGDYSDREAASSRSPITRNSSPSRAGLEQHCTDIIRFSHGASSSKKVYRSVLHPRPARRLHDFRETNQPSKGPL